MDSKDLLSLLKEPLFFDDWAAANFKAINLPPDWLAAQQSPYQILGGDPSAVRQSAEIALSPGWRAGWLSRRRGGRRNQRRRARKRGSFSAASWRLYVAAVALWPLLPPDAIAMAAVAVLRNDSLQAFLQVSL